MDLDKLKDVWKDVNPISPVGESEIYKMLGRRGRGALSRLILFELISVCILPLLIVVPFVHNHFLSKLPYSKLSMYLYIGVCVLAFFWGIYKLVILKKIDPSRLGIVLCARYITRYKKYIQYELFVGIAWCVVFFASFFASIANIIPSTLIWLFLLMSLVNIAVLFFFLLFIYKMFYKSNIQKIEDSLREIAEFEEGNI